MAKQFLRWKPVMSRNVLGEWYSCGELPELISGCYEGNLLSEILAMPSKLPISFEAAANLAGDKFMEAFKAHRMGYKPGDCNWYLKNFVQWISDQGFHIELTGDEFEPYAMSEKVA